MSSFGPEVLASKSAHPPDKLSFNSPQRPLGSAAVIAIPAIIGLSNSLVHSSGVKLVLSAMADLRHTCAPTPEEVARSTTVTHQHAGLQASRRSSHELLCRTGRVAGRDRDLRGRRRGTDREGDGGAVRAPLCRLRTPAPKFAL